MPSGCRIRVVGSAIEKDISASFAPLMSNARVYLRLYWACVDTSHSVDFLTNKAKGSAGQLVSQSAHRLSPDRLEVKIRQRRRVRQMET